MSVGAIIKSAVKKPRGWWLRPVTDTQASLLQATQIGLALRYRELISSGGPLPDLRDVGFRVYSDCDEDGILLYLFALVGTGSRRLIDIGAAAHHASNTANLLLHRGWTGLLIDADGESVRAAQHYYGRQASTRAYPPRIVNSFVTAENINDLVGEHGQTGEVDLLSIDVDGMDYWLWRALEVVTPRVVVIEFQDILGWEHAVTVPYSPQFRARDYAVNRHLNNYVGASLPAMAKVGRQKGYRLIGANLFGYNAFFVRQDLVPDLLPEVEPRSCLTHPWNEYGIRVRYPQVQDMEWVEV